MIKVGSFEAKTKLAELLDKVEAGETVTITRRGPRLPSSFRSSRSTSPSGDASSWKRSCAPVLEKTAARSPAAPSRS